MYSIQNIIIFIKCSKNLPLQKNKYFLIFIFLAYSNHNGSWSRRNQTWDCTMGSSFPKYQSNQVIFLIISKSKEFNIFFLLFVLFTYFQINKTNHKHIRHFKLGISYLSFLCGVIKAILMVKKLRVLNLSFVI